VRTHPGPSFSSNIALTKTCPDSRSAGKDSRAARRRAPPTHITEHSCGSSSLHARRLANLTALRLPNGYMRRAHAPSKRTVSGVAASSICTESRAACRTSSRGAAPSTALRCPHSTCLALWLPLKLRTEQRFKNPPSSDVLAQARRSQHHSRAVSVSASLLRRNGVGNGKQRAGREGSGIAFSGSCVCIHLLVYPHPPANQRLSRLCFPRKIGEYSDSASSPPHLQ
jgi:hypothetical protein